MQHPATLRRRLLNSAVALTDQRRAGEAGAGLTRLSDTDVNDVLSVTGRTVLVHLRAVTAHLPSASARNQVAVDVFERAAAFGIASRSAIGGVATVVGGLVDGELSAALAIGRCRAAFGDDQLRRAAVSLTAACLVRSAAATDLDPASVAKAASGRALRQRSSACAGRAGAAAWPAPWPRSDAPTRP